MRKRIHARRREAGFTIVEILVVVIIIAVLATLIVPRFFGRIGQTKQGVARQKLVEIEKAIETFSYDHGRPPQSLDELVTRPEDIPEQKWHPSLREKDLLDPWGYKYVYKQPGDHGAYDLSSLGADGEAGGESEDADVVNW